MIPIHRVAIASLSKAGYDFQMKIVWIAFVWPEPESSAAGYRTTQLLHFCKDSGHTVSVVSPCQRNRYSEKLVTEGFAVEQLSPNSSHFDEFITTYQPDLVVFDRFMIEEQFGWRIREHCPEALRVLDSIDLHLLRRLREQKVNRHEDPLVVSDAELHTDDAAREIASIHRCDLTLLVSSFELTFLQERYHVDTQLLQLLRFSYVEDKPKPISFRERKHFAIIGNNNHRPNADSFKILKNELWPRIKDGLRQKYGAVELHILGSYQSESLKQLDDEASGFRVKGSVSDACLTLSQYRVNLAPLRFGAGIKGKISDGWQAGTPAVTTSVGAEGMHDGFPFGGVVEDEWDAFIGGAIRLYENEAEWTQQQQNGYSILSKLYDIETNKAVFLEILTRCKKEQSARRDRNFIGTMLWYHQLRSTEYFSRWIEVKNKLPKAS